MEWNDRLPLSQSLKSIAGINSLQYFLLIRLQKARRLMLGESLDTATAGFRVGYEDPVYFSRDYRRQFNAPQQRDVSRREPKRKPYSNAGPSEN